jgi:hypothetical protein
MFLPKGVPNSNQAYNTIFKSWEWFIVNFVMNVIGGFGCIFVIKSHMRQFHKILIKRGRCNQVDVAQYVVNLIKYY